MSDQDLRELERRERSGDVDAAQRLERERDRRRSDLGRAAVAFVRARLKRDRLRAAREEFDCELEHRPTEPGGTEVSPCWRSPGNWLSSAERPLSFTYEPCAPCVQRVAADKSYQKAAQAMGRAWRALREAAGVRGASTYIRRGCVNLSYYQATTRYRRWIEANVDQRRVLGECEKVCKDMLAKFPELELRKGFYHDRQWGQRAHFWVRFKVPDEEDYQIVDPTVGQFPCGWKRRLGGERYPCLFPVEKEVSAYEDMTDVPDDALADIVPSGVCMDCGGPTFHGDEFCSSACRESTAAWFNAGCPPELM